MSLAPLHRSPLVDQAVERLRAQISAGHWPVGSKLPGETTLAKELGVGRSTVREALRALAGAGLVRSRQGSGVTVVATEPDEDWPTRLRRAEVVDLYEVRQMIEVQAARAAALRRTDADLAAMDEALAKRRAAAGDTDDAAFVDADIALHAAVVAAARNPVLADLFATFVPVLRRGLIDLLALTGERARTPDLGDSAHADLVEAVRRGDPDGAAEVIATELGETVRRLRVGRE
ncbi:FCD domain-containing protein [Streptomyces sp. NPDC003077]|uniref:FadR/GntR family transcriptional regulator n=1 Tax=Streptomyces sp. NPDC003077 TaxID=3154443 RepID=UPI0033AD0230